MPSLRALEEFKSSFNHLGNELQILREMEIPRDDLPLPDHEPVPMETSGGDVPEQGGADKAVFDEAFPEDTGIDSAGNDETGGADFNAFSFDDLGDLLGGLGDTDISAAETADGVDDGRDNDAAFGSFIDSIPDDFDSPDGAGADEAGAGNAETGGIEPGGINFDDLGDFSLAPELSGEEGFADEDSAALLDGFADEIENARIPDEPTDPIDPTDPANPMDSVEELAEAPFGGQRRIDQIEPLDIDTLESLELQSEEAAEELPDFGGNDGAPEESDSLGSPDFFSRASEETGAEDFFIPDLADLPEADSPGGMDLPVPEELSGEESAVNDAAGPDFGAESFGDGLDLSALGIEELPEFDSEETKSLESSDFFPGASEETGETLPDENSGAAELADEEDNFDLGGETADFDTGAVLEELPGDAFDRFSLDSGGGSGKLDDFSLELDSVFDGSLPAKAATGADVETGSGGNEWDGTGGTGEVEEIRLSEREMEQLRETLSSYPLNLRIACEELIAEEVVAPDQLSRLLGLLVQGASAGETAALAGRILGRTIPVPKGYEKKTGEALEIEQSSFAYIFTHNFLPMLRLFAALTLVLLSAGYLCWKFIYQPVKAEGLYKLGLGRIEAGEYSRANERFAEAFKIHEKKSWFYIYARAFRDARQYTLAEEKYQELLYYTALKNKRQIPEKEAVLEYAELETNYIGDFETADNILRTNILDYFPYDSDALLALGDNSLAWGEYEPSRLENAREYFALYMEHNGRTDPLLERMLKYFIRTDNLGETLPLQSYFMASPKRNISAATLAELGGYLLDKRYETVRGVPNEYLDSIGGIREVLLRAIRQDSMLPESYYHLARYYNYYENPADEAATLELAARVFDAVEQETPARLRYHILTLQRYGEILTGRKEFFPAEERLVKAVNLYEDGLSRRVLTPAPEYGKLYAGLGDLEYFVKDGDMESALAYYRLGEGNGFAPPEIQYRMGAAHYQLRQWGPALERIYSAYRETAPNRRILYALGNASYMRGNYFAAQGYYDKLLGILEADRERFPPITAGNDEKQLDLAERLMVVQNNMGVTLDALTERTGNNSYRARAQGLYTDSERAWDVLTRNPQSMLRMRPSPEISAPGVNPAYLNVRNSLYPAPGYEPQFFLRIDKDALEPSPWEDLAPPGYRISEGIYTGR